MTRRQFMWWLASLIALRMVMVWVTIAGVAMHGGGPLGWYVPQGDEAAYLRAAAALSHGQAVDSVRPIGFPLVLVPFIWFIGADTLEVLAAPIAFFHGSMLAGAAIGLIIYIATQATRRPAVALLAAGLWTLWPVLVYLGVHTNPAYGPDVPIKRLAHQLWIQVASDPPSTVLVLMTAALCLAGRNHPSWRASILAGITAGWAGMVRLPNVVWLPLGLVWFGRHSWRRGAAFAAAWSAAIAPQLLMNWAALGAPWRFSGFHVELERSRHLTELAGYPITTFAPANLPFLYQQLMAKVPPALWLAAAAVAFVALIGAIQLYGRERTAAWFCAGWIGSYALLLGIHQDFYISVLHLLMPVIPAVMILVALTIDGIVTGLRPGRSHP